MSNWSIKQRLREEILEAVEKGDTEKVEYLLGRGADVNESEGGYIAKKTVLLLAIEKNHEHIAKLLVDKGADLTVTVTLSGTKKTVPDIARDKGFNDLANYMQYKLDMNERLTASVKDGYIDYVQDNINRGGDVNVMYRPPEIDQPDCTLLQLALIKGHVDIAKILLQNGVELHHVMKWDDQSEDTAKSYAERMNYDDIVKLIEEKLKALPNNNSKVANGNGVSNYEEINETKGKHVEVYDIEDVDELQENNTAPAMQAHQKKKNGNCVIS
ncbi:ankyrin repeat domain-containing protein 50-like isoform X1 [Lytechinus variegatus]|uniref:ankyrin repeat domain-containing protein 50-like isoform X1 n=1 Tax=Lytechinus variegatus TaxID=7654 RepID=UPI001BB29B20|nr:ankyrin repeat domain-containing protein 50-like isoform X1 [Lytechinus variegatus]